MHEQLTTSACTATTGSCCTRPSMTTTAQRRCTGEPTALSLAYVSKRQHTSAGQGTSTSSAPPLFCVLIRIVVLSHRDRHRDSEPPLFCVRIRMRQRQRQRQRQRAEALLCPHAHSVSSYACSLCPHADAAEETYRRVLRLDNNQVDTLCSYALLLKDVRNDMAHAKQLIRRAQVLYVCTCVSE